MLTWRIRPPAGEWNKGPRRRQPGLISQPKKKQVIIITANVLSLPFFCFLKIDAADCEVKLHFWWLLLISRERRSSNVLDFF